MVHRRVLEREARMDVVICAFQTGPSEARPTMDLFFRFYMFTSLSCKCHATTLVFFENYFQNLKKLGHKVGAEMTEFDRFRAKTRQKNSSVDLVELRLN